MSLLEEQHSYYIIMSTMRAADTDRPLFWSNEDGWQALSQATIFTQDERKRLNLPFGACEWLRLPPFSQFYEATT